MLEEMRYGVVRPREQPKLCQLCPNLCTMAEDEEPAEGAK